MDLYGVLLFVHVLAVAVWAGGAVMTNVLAERMYASRDKAALRGLLAQSERIGKTYFMPSAVIALISGIVLVLQRWTWEEPFVVVGIVGLVATVVVGAILLTPKEKALMEALSSPDPDDGKVRAAFAQIRTLSRIDMALLVIIIFFMTAKPGT